LDFRFGLIGALTKYRLLCFGNGSFAILAIMKLTFFTHNICWRGDIEGYLLCNWTLTACSMMMYSVLIEQHAY